MQNDLLETYTDLELSIDCYKIVLTQEHSDTNKPIEYSGPGVIYQDGEDKFGVKLFCQNDVDYTYDLLKINRIRPGEIIRDEEFFTMKAYDMYGTVWESNSILPQLSGNIPENNFIAHGNFNKLFTTNQNKSAYKKNELKLFYRGKLPIPINSRTVTKEYIKNEKRGDSIKADVTQFSFGDFEFEIHVTEDWIILWLFTKNKIDYRTIQRVNEAFHLVMGITQSWNIAMIQDETNNEMILKSFTIDSVKSRVNPPIAIKALSQNNSYWRLFERYFSFASEHPDDDWHPLYDFIYKVVESGKASLDASTLTIAVAVEGTIKLFGCKNVDTEVKAEVAKVKAALKTVTLDKSFSERLSSMLGGMPQLRAIDLLYNLSNNDVIDEKLILCWKRLRNKTAHSGDLDFSKIQQHLNELSATVVLFYQLVFLLIEYEGEYTDYSTYHYPSAEFKIPSALSLIHNTNRTQNNDETSSEQKQPYYTRRSRRLLMRKHKTQRRFLRNRKTRNAGRKNRPNANDI